MQKLADSTVSAYSFFAYRCVKQQETWDTMFSRLLKYKMMHGDCLVPQKYKEDSRLGEWVQTQRRDKKRRRNLSIQRQARLEAIGFEWW